MPGFPRPLARLATVLLWAGLLWGAVHALLTLLSRFTHPFQLEWSEGSTFLQALRFAREGVVYTDPWNSLFTPHLYTPLHSVVLGGALTVLPPELWVGRALSLLCTLGTGLLLVRAARRCGALPGPAWLPLPLLLALAPALAYWFDLVRVDTLFTLLFAGAMLCHLRLLQEGGTLPLVGSALLLVLSGLTKQTGYAYGPVFFLGLLLWGGWRRALAWGAVAGGILALALGVCQAWSDGWFWFYTMEVLGRHQLETDPHQWTNLWRELRLFLPLLAAAGLVGWRRTGNPAAGGRRLLLLLSAWGLPWTGYAFLKHGGFTNAWLPLLVTLLPLLPAAAPGWRTGLSRLAVAICLALVLHAPLSAGWWRQPQQVPLPGDAAATQQVVDRLARVGGPVWCPDNVWLSFRAGGDILPLLHLVGELMEPDPDGGVRLPVPLALALQSRRFSALLFCENTLDPAFAGRTTLDLLTGDARYRNLVRMIRGNYLPARATRLTWPTPWAGYQRVGLLYRPALLVPAKGER